MAFCLTTGVSTISKKQAVPDAAKLHRFNYLIFTYHMYSGGLMLSVLDPPTPYQTQAWILVRMFPV